MKSVPRCEDHQEAEMIPSINTRTLKTWICAVCRKEKERHEIEYPEDKELSQAGRVQKDMLEQSKKGKK